MRRQLSAGVLLGMMAGASGCLSMSGLTQLPALPPDFPIEAVGEVGNITQSGVAQSGLVGTAADYAFANKVEAREGYATMLTEARGEGWKEVETKLDPEGIVFEKGGERLFIGCCLPRADRKRLAIVNWHHKPR